MKLLKLYLIIGVIFTFSCKKEKVDSVRFDNSFAAARLDSITNLGNNKYIAHISPAFEPVNPSAYFAFTVSSKSEKEIEIQLNYGKHKHRYIPKLSTDRKIWKKIDSNSISIDTVNHTATIKLTVSPQKLYVAAQEIETTKDTYLWVDGLLKANPDLTKIVAGKTVLNNDNYCLELENENIKNAIGLIARQHPPEIPGGTVGFKAFYETLLSDSETAKTFRNHFNIYTFPLFNPDGADMGNWRHNAKGVDLNRDWQDFTQPETQMAKSYFENKASQGQKLRFALDFHTSHSGPYLLVLDSLNQTTSKGITIDWIKNIKSNSKFKVQDRKRSQDLPYCYNYFYNQFGCEGVTYEDGDEVDRNLIREKGKVYATQLMKTLIHKIKTNAFEE
jgi:hypothetical protein